MRLVKVVEGIVGSLRGEGETVFHEFGEFRFPRLSPFAFPFLSSSLSPCLAFDYLLTNSSPTSLNSTSSRRVPNQPLSISD